MRNKRNKRVQETLPPFCKYCDAEGHDSFDCPKVTNERIGQLEGMVRLLLIACELTVAHIDRTSDYAPKLMDAQEALDAARKEMGGERYDKHEHGRACFSTRRPDYWNGRMVCRLKEGEPTWKGNG